MAEYWADAAYGAGGHFAGVSWSISILLLAGGGALRVCLKSLS